MEGGMQLSRNQTLITEENLKKMGDDLIRLCDQIERHGLVDYQYGVWEEQIEESKSNSPVLVHSKQKLTCFIFKQKQFSLNASTSTVPTRTRAVQRLPALVAKLRTHVHVRCRSPEHKRRSLFLAILV